MTLMRSFTIAVVTRVISQDTVLQVGRGANDAVCRGSKIHITDSKGVADGLGNMHLPGSPLQLASLLHPNPQLC